MLKRSLIIPICGGLGGQIYGYTLYLYMKTIEQSRKVYADISTLSSSNIYRLADAGGGLNTYIWDLGYYGISENSDPNFITSVSFREKLLSRVYFSFLKEGKFRRSILYNKSKSLITPSLFPVSSKHHDIIDNEFRGQRIAVVHVRQSDYLNVASRVLKPDSSLNLVKKLIRLSPDRLIYVSDGFIEADELSRALNFTVEFFDTGDHLLTHALMRRADILVGTNSQFSLTASLLSFNQLSFFPKNFYGDNFVNLNRVYQESFANLAG